MPGRFFATVTHEGLGKQRIISGTDRDIVEAKARAQVLTWEHQYAERQARDRAKHEAAVSTAAAKRALEANIDEAEERTRDAKAGIELVRNTLQRTLQVNDAIAWEQLKNNLPFSKPEPEAPNYMPYPDEPNPESSQFQPVLTVLDKLVKSRTEKKVQAAREHYEAAHAAWTQAVDARHSENERCYNEYLAAIERWNRERQEYEDKKARENASVDRRRSEYESLQPGAIEDYCELVLSRSEYPDSFPKDFELEYIPATRILVADYSLPSPDDLPRLKVVRYIKSKDEFAESFLSDREFNTL